MCYFLLTFFVHDETCVDAVSFSWSPGALWNFKEVLPASLKLQAGRTFLTGMRKDPGVQLTPEPHGCSMAASL